MADIEEAPPVPPRKPPTPLERSLIERQKSIDEERARDRQNGLSLFKGTRWSTDDAAKKRYKNMQDEGDNQ